MTTTMLEATFLRFATYMAKWQPPGRGGRGVCGFCNGTYKFVADAPVIRDLPHDVSHYLVWELHVEYNRAYEALVDQEAERAIVDMDDFDLPNQQHERLVELALQLEEDMLDAIDAHLDDLERAPHIHRAQDRGIRTVHGSRCAVTAGLGWLCRNGRLPTTVELRSTAMAEVDSRECSDRDYLPDVPVAG